MSSIDALTKRAYRLQGRTSTARLEERWEELCAGAKDELLSELEYHIQQDREVGVIEKEPTMTDEEFEAFCAEGHTVMQDLAESAKQAYFQNARFARRR